MIRKMISCLISFCIVICFLTYSIFYIYNNTTQNQLKANCISIGSENHQKVIYYFVVTLEYTVYVHMCVCMCVWCTLLCVRCVSVNGPCQQVNQWLLNSS